MQQNHPLSYGKFNIKIAGIGGAGNNVICHISKESIAGHPELVAFNTDSLALDRVNTSKNILLGEAGLGAGMRPDSGRKLAKESSTIVEEVLRDANLVIITAGIGKGTGSGATPIVAEIAKSLSAFTAVVVSMPFSYEGRRCRQIADSWLEFIAEHTDALIIFPNEKLEQLFADNSMMEWLELADNGIAGLIKAIASIASFGHPFFSALDPLESLMGRHMFEAMGSGTADNAHQIRDAAQQALSSGFFIRSDPSMADTVLFNIRSGRLLSYKEILPAIIETRSFFGPLIPILKSVEHGEGLGEAVSVSISALSRPVPRKYVPPRAA